MVRFYIPLKFVAKGGQEKASAYKKETIPKSWSGKAKEIRIYAGNYDIKIHIMVGNKTVNEVYVKVENAYNIPLPCEFDLPEGEVFEILTTSAEASDYTIYMELGVEA
jgi:hypothetical protein